MLTVICQILHKYVSKIGEVVGLQGIEGNIVPRVVNVIWGSKPPIEASTTPQNVTDTTFHTKVLKHVFKNIQLLILYCIY